MTLDNEYEIVEELKANRQPWDIVPEQDLQRRENEMLIDHCPTIEIELNHPLLKERFQIIIPPDYHYDYLKNLLEKSMEKILPVILYILEDKLLEEVIKEESKIGLLWENVCEIIFKKFLVN